MGQAESFPEVNSSSAFEVKINRTSATRGSSIALQKGSLFTLFLYCKRYRNTYAHLSLDGIVAKRRYFVDDDGATIDVDPSKHFNQTLLRPGNHTLRVTFATKNGTVLDVIEADLLVN